MTISWYKKMKNRNALSGHENLCPTSRKDKFKCHEMRMGFLCSHKQTTVTKQKHWVPWQEIGVVDGIEKRDYVPKLELSSGPKVGI